MKVVLDTNVLVSGIFFSGPPAGILRAWSQGKLQLVLSPEILDEYMRVSAELAVKYPDIRYPGHSRSDRCAFGDVLSGSPWVAKTCGRVYFARRTVHGR